MGMTRIWYLLLVIGGIFGILGSTMAYLVTYREWAHHYESSKMPRRMAIEAAIEAFIVFVAVVLAVGFFVASYVTGGTSQ